ncbi:MAG: hypothetical protein Q9166_007368 [cf. Caloplaca sp. 2 TL-2023]
MGDIDVNRRPQDEDFFQENTQTSSHTKPPQRLQRPRHRDNQWHENLVNQQAPPEEPQMERQASKSRLLSIFTRVKSTKSAKNATELGRETDHSILNQDGQFPVTAVRATSQDIGNDAMSDLASTGKAIKQQPSMTKRPKSFKRNPSSAKSIPWDPPPLFQAYPQSIKHTTLPTPAMSADAILRYQSNKKRKPKRRDASGEPRGSNDANPDEEKLKDDGEDSLQLGEWAPKVYLLVTSGYFLQYAGEGNFDRLPEKILPIGKDSAAFASDAVPSKHWVLQVSHASDENGNPKIENPLSFFRRLGIGGDLKRCSASNFLLVLDSPKELDAWLSAVRREIESWGGKRYHHVEATRPSDEEASTSLQHPSSRRLQVKRDPNQFSKVTQDADASWGVPALPGRKYSTATENSMPDCPSTSNDSASADQNILDRLRISPRMSYYSSGVQTSRESSPVPSPTKLAFHLSDFPFSQQPLAMDDRTGKIETQHHPHPTFTGRSSQQPLIPAPNFSVPSFSKRYSSTQSTSPLSTASSSSAGNLPRKSISPPAINEGYDNHPIDASRPANTGHQQLEPLGAAARTKVDRVPSADKFEPKMTDPLSQLAQPLLSDNTVPRRLSSLEYSRGISPNLRASPKPSPHPPPTSALPALPESRDLPTSTRKLHRPISMQVHTFPPASTSANGQPLPMIASPSVENPMSFASTPSRAPPPPPSIDDPLPLGVPSVSHKVQNRRSMPHLSRPPHDPPNCPLPTPPVPKLPSIKLSSGSLRRSVERPLRAGLGPRAPGLLKETNVEV